MFKKYLKTIGLKKLSVYESKSLNNFVAEVFAKKPDDLTSEQIQNLYVYDVPEMSLDGSCSVIGKKAEKPYNLAETFGLDFHFESLKNDPQTLRLWRLNKIVYEIYRLTKVEWFGIYRKIKNPAGKLVLVKESYQGLFSRAEFPLTKTFAKKSNNSTVGLSGKAIVIQDVAAHTGAYYKCDGEVNSEFCLPILDAKGLVIGIIDAEAFAKNYYTDERLIQIAKVAYDLGVINLGIT